jgi:hypothetical protein
MKNSWTQGLDEQATKDVRGDFSSSLITRKRLAKLLEEKIKSADKSSLNKEGYDIANWALKQADLIGYKRALIEVIDLIL